MVVLPSALVLLVAGLVMAQAAFTPITLTVSFLGVLPGGDVSCSTGLPTGTWPPCPPGSKARIRGMHLLVVQQSSDPLGTGLRTKVFNADLDAAGSGHIWGTWTVELAGGRGTWEGIYTGKVEGYFGRSEVEVTGHGTQGQVDGLLVKLTAHNDAFPFGAEMDTGYYLNPHRSQ